MSDQVNADKVQQMLVEMNALRQQVTQLEARLNPVNLPAKPAVVTAHRPFWGRLTPKFGLAIALAFALMLALGGLWAGSLQAQAQTGPKVKNFASTGPSVSMPKFCAGCDRSGTVFPVNYDLSNAYMAGTNYSNTTLTNATFSNAYLTGTFFNNATLTGAFFTGAILYGADLTGAALSGSDLTGAIFYNATLSGANLSNANLTGTDLSNATLTNALLNSATLTKATLTSSILTGANLTGTNLTGAHGTPASITGITWSNTICPDGTNSDLNSGTCAGHWIV